MRRVPASTYRLQMNRGFTFHDAARVVPYIHTLGADWLYLSPILRSEPGSDHGYDVVDHDLIDPERGGREGFETLVRAARSHGMGVIVDIVPNHVGIASPMNNRWWADVLRNGPSSRYADAFDIDWAFGGGKIRIPVLGDEPEPALRVADGCLCYAEHRFPLAEGSARVGDPVAEVHARQHYELVNWRRADHELNYRRFFAVNTLAGIRVELPWVFEESHAEIVRWVSEGWVDGLRIDHPDGLADPGGYLDALAATTDGAYVVIEKILQPDEFLPSSWAFAGTTGYDGLADIDRVLVDPEGRVALRTVDARHRHEMPVAWPTLIHDTKLAVANGILHSEVLRIARDCALDEHDGQLADAISETMACFPVYRSYLPFGLEHLEAATEAATRHRPDLADAIHRLLGALSNPDHPAAIRFQQTSGMVMAKGVEDTAFYRYSRLGSLNEVGADPSQFSITIDEFHRRQQRRQAMFPTSLVTLSTHDTKRGEDVRARLHALAEVPAEWSALLDILDERCSIGDPPLEQLLWQTVIGAWPLSRERLHAYAEKAAREAGSSTDWAAPSERFETMMHTMLDRLFDDDIVSTAIDSFVREIAPAGWSNALAATLLQIAGPGVPDIYQGSELWETSLVDPDNRRSVDYTTRARSLAWLDAGHLPPIDERGVAKLAVTSRALRLGRDHPELFHRYAPVDVFGAAGSHVVAFDRGEVVGLATRLPIGLRRAGGWGDTTVHLAARPTIDVITGRRFDGGVIAVADLLSIYPVALLAPDEADRP